ncbi:MAG TPA: hypothetical protein PK395_18755 [bacterium]|nr:hypothetical protein [bacterium]
MKIIFTTIILAILLTGCISTDISKVPELPGDLSLTEPPEYPGYLLIAPSDLSRIMTRMHDAELKLQENYKDGDTSIP